MDRGKGTIEAKLKEKHALHDRMAGLQAVLGLDDFPGLVLTIL